MLEFKVWNIRRVDTDSSFRAFVDVAVSEELLIKGFKVMEGDEGLYVLMPSELSKEGKRYIRVSCLRPEVKDELTKVVLDAYNEQTVQV